MIEITIDRNTVETGSFLSARIRWAGDRRVNRIIAAAQWETVGKGNRAWAVGRSKVFVPNRGAREATFPLRLMIPHEGPVTFEGTLIAVAWTLKVHIDQSGVDEYEEASFRVEPRVVRRNTGHAFARQPG